MGTLENFGTASISPEQESPQNVINTVTREIHVHGGDFHAAPTESVEWVGMCRIEFIV